MKPDRAQITDFAILILRWYLAFYMVDYGVGKLTGEQFIRNADILNTPLKDVSKFNLAWHLFSLDKTFNVVLGLMQIAGAVLLVINRTVLPGALFLLPVLGQIFLIDVTYTTNTFGMALPIRIGSMIVCDLLILYYYKDRVLTAWQALTLGTSTKFTYRWWIYLSLPILGFLTDFLLAFVTYPIKLLTIWLRNL